MLKKKFFTLSFLLTFSTLLQADPFWTTVLAGNSTAAPVSWNKHLYVIGADKALNCLDINGSFVWRRNTDGVGNFISVSQSGLVFVSTKRGTLQAFSSQGIPIWSFKLDEAPLFVPYSSLDGRLFVLTAKTLFCFTQHGVLKWKRKLNAAPALNIAETANGEVLLVLQNGDFLRYSIFGHLNEEKKLVKKVTALSKAPSGYLMACSDGSLFYYKTIAGSESQWQVKTSSPCIALAYASGKYLAVCADGSLWLSTVEQNEKVWYTQVEKNFSFDEVGIRFLKNEIQISANGFGASIRSSGEIRWQQSIPETTTRAVIGENGMLVGVNGKIVNAYRMEVKFLRPNKHAEILDDSYGIIENIPTEIPPVFDSAGSKSFFDEVYSRLADGSFSEHEAEYAANLSGILQNKWAMQFGQNFSDYERAEAARLLGSFGSYEYRRYLLRAGYATDNRTILIGIIDGLAQIAYDPDGETIEFLKRMLLKSRQGDVELMRAVCDCLEQLSKFGDNTIISNSLTMLFSIINGKFTNNIKSYARQKIENIVQ